MKLKLDLEAKSRQWAKYAPMVTKEVVLKIICKTFEILGISDLNTTLQLSVYLSIDSGIKKYNAEFRGKDKPTNVLSFPTEELNCLDLHSCIKGNQYMYLGEIIMSYDQLMLESKEQQKNFMDHFTHLLIHSLLHLLGFDHEVEKDREIMESTEILILKHFNIKNPYV